MRHRVLACAREPSLLQRALCCLLFVLLAKAEKSIHTVFTTECSTYFNWQTIAIYYSHQKSGQKGPVTRLLSCTEEQLKFYKDVEGVPTHIAPSWSIHPRTGDAYSGINKPVAVKDWLEKAKPKEDYILIIDSDTVMREGFDVDEMDIKPGWAVSGYYGYLKGVDNELAMRHIPNVQPRNDTFAGPLGRRSDQVGGFTFMAREDLRRMAADWVTITEDVRADPEAWTLSGDAFTTKPGDKPWIAEMYGYSFAAAKANVWHHTNDRVMLYPGYMPLGLHEAPKVLHYGIEYRIQEPPFSFDKHWYQAFDPLLCPPWMRRNEAGRPVGGLFPLPPHPSLLPSTGVERLRDLLAIEAMATVNEALCTRHVKACPPSQELDARCHEIFELSKAVASAHKTLSTAPTIKACRDEHVQCLTWARAEECVRNPRFMEASCRLSCGLCNTQNSSQAEHKAQVTEQARAPPEPKPVAKDESPKEKVPQKETPRNVQGIAKVVPSHGLKSSHSVRAGIQVELLRLCHSNTAWNLAEVKECVRLAKQNLPYKPAARQRSELPARQARPSFAGEEARKASPGGNASDSEGAGRAQPHKAARRLSAGVHEGESEVWDGEHIALATAGAVFMLLVAACAVCGCLPGGRRRSFSGKHVRRD